MDALHNLLREATNPRNNANGAASRGLTTTNSTMSASNGLSSMGMGMVPPQGSMNGMGMPMGMNLPMPMSNGLAPIHRMNPLMAANSQMFPSLGGAGGAQNGSAGMGLPVPPSAQLALSGASPVQASNGNAAKDTGKATKAATKKRKAPSAPSSNVDENESGDDDKQPEEYEDPKAKRRAQIAKAARKHRQRQKDELVALRAKVKDLKEQIEVLQSSEPSEHNTELGWKQEAEQHAEIRARVDQENEFLRKTLMEQMKFIQRLQDYFTKQPLLNMPSLDLILNQSASASTNPSTLANTIASSSTTLQLQSSSFTDQLMEVATKAMASADQQLSQCDSAFRAPKNPTMTYFGLQVQYEMSKNEMAIFFNHQLFNCDASTVMDDLWNCAGDAGFEKQFPFVDSVEVLETIDNDTKYVRRVVNLTVGNDAAHTGGIMKEEQLCMNQKQMNADGSLYFVAKSVDNDPNHPKGMDYIRRNQTTVVSLRNFKDATGSGCVLMWSVKVLIDAEPDERSKSANIPDIILKNLFEISPVMVKGLVDRHSMQKI